MPNIKVLKMGLLSRVGYEHVGEPLREALPPKLKAKFARYGARKVTYQCCGRPRSLGMITAWARPSVSSAGKIGQLDKIMKMNLNSAQGQTFCAKRSAG